MSRGTLIFPFLARIKPIDTEATDDASQYDHDFKEPTAAGVVYGDPYDLPMQFETERNEFEKLVQLSNGQSPRGKVHTIHHFRDLEDRGMIDAEGHPTIRKGDQLVALYDLDGNLVLSLNRVPVYVDEVQPRSFGLIPLKVNILQVTYATRDKGALAAN